MPANRITLSFISAPDLLIDERLCYVWFRCRLATIGSENRRPEVTGQMREASALKRACSREAAVKRSTPEPRPTPTSKAADKSVHPTCLVRRMGSGVCRSVIVEKLVVEDGGHQPQCILDIDNRVLDSNQPCLARYAALLLDGAFFW